jgi:hypothetical protein
LRAGGGGLTPNPISPHDRWPVILAVPVVSAPALAIIYEYCVVTCTCALSDVTFSFLRAGDVKRTVERYILGLGNIYILSWISDFFFFTRAIRGLVDKILFWQSEGRQMESIGFY